MQTGDQLIHLLVTEVEEAIGLFIVCQQLQLDILLVTRDKEEQCWRISEEHWTVRMIYPDKLFAEILLDDELGLIALGVMKDLGVELGQEAMHAHT